MKKILIFLVSTLCFFLTYDVVEAIESSGTNLDGIVGKGCGNVDSCWADITTDHSLRGFRLTLYKFENNQITKVGKSFDFINNQTEIDIIKQTSGIHYVSAQSSKVSYKLGTSSFNVVTATSTNNFYNNLYPLDFKDFFGINNADQNYTESLIKNLLKSGNDKILEFFNQRGNDDASLYYASLEPLTYIIYNNNSSRKIRFYGTSYEHARYLNENSVGSSYVSSVTRYAMPRAAIIESITEKNGSNFTGFLNAAGIALANSNSDIEKYLSGGRQMYYKEAIMNKAFGIQLFWVPDAIGVQTQNCINEVESNICGEISIHENGNDQKVCTLGNGEKQEYGSGNYIYCSSNIRTHFNEFYNTFNSSKLSGSYFPMNSLIVDVTKTCYIQINNSSSSIYGWQDYIPKDVGGTIKLKIGNRDYDLTSSQSSDTVQCSYTNGICSKATQTTTYTYSLNPLVNRFINIETMAEDENQYQTDYNIDNGGPRLTIPLNYLTGSYKYQLDIRGSLINKYKEKLLNNKVYNVSVNGTMYDLTYKTNKVLTDNDLSFSCRYQATQDQCEDENGNLMPCPVDKCEYECCDENGKEITCPVQCEYECCNSEGKEITCPGGDSIVDNIIYRPISLTNPFPGIDGDGRLPGSNWMGTVISEGKTYTKSDYYIKYNRGYSDYEVYQTEPLYVIKLDSDIIKAIRDYNDYKNHNYNDFDLECSGGQNCISKFLRGRAEHFTINLIDSGTCKNINPRTFDSCITRKGA